MAAPGYRGCLTFIQMKNTLAKKQRLGYTTTMIFLDVKENFGIRRLSESRWQVKTGGATISFHFPVKGLKAFAHQGENPWVVSFIVR